MIYNKMIRNILLVFLCCLEPEMQFSMARIPSPFSGNHQQGEQQQQQQERQEQQSVYLHNGQQEQEQEYDLEAEPDGIHLRFHVIIPWRHYFSNRHSLNRAQEKVEEALTTLNDSFQPNECYRGKIDIGTACSAKEDFTIGPCITAEWEKYGCHRLKEDDLEKALEWVEIVHSNDSWIRIKWVERPEFTYDNSTEPL